MDKTFIKPISDNIPICPVCNNYMIYDPSGEWYCPFCSSKQSGFVQVGEMSGAGTVPPYAMEYTKIRVGAFPDYEARISKLEKELKELKSKSEAKSEEQEIILKTLPRDEALKLIKKYINKNPGCRTSDIILNLEIEPDLVLEVISTLRQRGEIRSEKIE